MKSTLFLATLLILASCGPRRPGRTGKAGLDGNIGNAGISAGVDLQDAGAACYNGGVVISAFKDYNNDGILDINEPVNSVKTLCNGVNGQNASVNLEALAVGNSQCPAGGILISSTGTGSVPVCNGVNGLNGAQGVQGLQGIPGIAGPQGPQGPAGVNGSSAVPVKLCSSDSAAFPEYGILLNNELYAVYSSNVQAFLAKLTAGTYVTTNGANCQFTVNAQGQTAPVASVPVGSTHKLTFCGVDVYKTGSGLSYNGTLYTSSNGANSFTAGGCSVTYNNNGNHVSVNGCNYNNVSQLQTGANVGNGCQVTKL